jgi:hypothetical protein
MAVYRASTGQWFAYGPSGGHLVGTWGLQNFYDVPAETSVASLVKLGVTGPSGSRVHRSSLAALSTASAPLVFSGATASASGADHVQPHRPNVTSTPGPAPSWASLFRLSRARHTAVNVLTSVYPSLRRWV